MYPYNLNPNESGNENNTGNMGSTGGPQNPYYTPLGSSSPAPQQRLPDENGNYHFVPANQSPYQGQSATPPPSGEPKKKKKGIGKTGRFVAAAAALIVVSAAAGGGTAMYVLNNAPGGGNSGGTILQAATYDKVEAQEGSVASVAQIAAASVVEIDTKTQQDNFFMSTLVPGAGSGVIISEDGYVVTNNHVVDGAQSIVVRLQDGTEYEAKLIGTDAETDLAVLKVEATGLKAVTFADSDQIQVGDVAIAIGNPLGELGGTVTSGIISATSRDIAVDGNTMTLLQTSAAINPGNSGGGLFDSNGHLIGVVNAKSSGVEIEGLGFAIPSNTVQQVVPDIIDKGYVSGRTEMGIQVITIQDSMTAQMYGVTKAGIYVMDPGENDGLQQGDRFVFIDGQSIDSSADISTVLKKHGVGDTLKVTVERNGQAVETEVTLREKTPESATQGEEEVQTPSFNWGQGRSSQQLVPGGDL